MAAGPKCLYHSPDDAHCDCPFIYQGKSYSSCTQDHSSEMWCATKVNPYTRQMKLGSWKSCETKENGGNDGGRPCVFPFVYKGNTYNTCINKSSSRYWCATTGNYDKDGKWSRCADTIGQHCVCPFIYNGKSYSSCTKDDANAVWCATEVDPDTKEMIESKWKECKTKENGGNDDGRPCVFPFVYNGETYNTCTNKNAMGYWCATTGNYDKDGKRSICAHTSCWLLEARALRAAVLGAYPAGCLQSLLSIMKEKKSKRIFFLFVPLCSSRTHRKVSQHNFHKLTQGLSTNPTGPCVFPFIYKGKPYTGPSCTADGESTESLWCSLTCNYDEDPKWTYCDPSGMGKTEYTGIRNRTSKDNHTLQHSGGRCWRREQPAFLK
ncbi:epididymal sperm-binding protein 1-like [Zootoca vivipara]|uniref:epididymal sperm-binding protein 1-like n=1 Tax=Zootoca vivipara TaxID=8524 RepID=UPI00293BC6C3|nr:epididymal sperm-binding protein 1-like [Zootoca vivipara]